MYIYVRTSLIFVAKSMRAVVSTAFRRIAGKTRACSSLVTVERANENGHVAILRFNRPNQLNAMTEEMGDAFKQTVEMLRNDEDLRCVVLTGEGRAFSAGGDVAFLRKRMADSPLNNAKEMVDFYRRYLCVRDLHVPVIAAINGHAVGAGMCVAMACDMRIASPRSKIGFTFSKLGLHPGMGATHFLPNVAGPEVAARMLLTGELVDGNRACELNIVGAVADDPLREAVELATSIAASGPVAVQTCVRTLRKAQSRGLEDALWREADAQSQCYNSEDMEEGVSAVVEKRSPRF